MNFEAQGLFNKINNVIAQKNLPIRVEIIRKNYRRDDAPGWKKDFFDIRFDVINFFKDRHLVLDQDELKELINELESMNFFKKIFKIG